MDNQIIHHRLVECFVIDDASHEVLLSVPRVGHVFPDSQKLLWGGLVDYLNESVQDPIYTAIATTQEHIHRLIPPSEWILLGTYDTPSSTTIIFATTWDLSRMVDTHGDLFRVPLSQIKDHPNIHQYVKNILSSFADDESCSPKRF